MVGAGAVLGVLLLVAGGMLFTVDPGFLFAVLPVIIGAVLVAGFQLLTVSVSLSRQLLKHQPGARLQAAVIGGCVMLSGLVGCTIAPLMGLPIAVYGAVLFWLMTTSAASRDLGPWVVVRAPRNRSQQMPRWVPRSWRPAPTPTEQPPSFFTGSQPLPGGQPPFFTGAGPGAKRQRPATWMELWQEGLGRIPLADLVAVVIGLVAFVVGDVLMFMTLVGAHHGGLPVALLLIGAAIAIHVVLERRMLARLGYA